MPRRRVAIERIGNIEMQDVAQRRTAVAEAQAEAHVFEHALGRRAEANEATVCALSPPTLNIWKGYQLLNRRCSAVNSHRPSPDW